MDNFDNLIADMIDSSLDVDRLDYLSRDAYSTGLYEGAINVSALIENMVPFKEENRIMLAYRESAVPYIEHFMYARDIMFIKCYEHPTKICADTMLIKALASFIDRYKLDDKIDDIVLLSDEQLMDLINVCSTNEYTCWKLVNALRNGIVFELAYEMGLPIEGHFSNKINDLLESIVKGNFKYAYIDLISSWESEIANMAGLRHEDSWKIAIAASSPEVILQKEAATKILFERKGKYECKEIYAVSSLLKAGFIDILKKSRWKMRIFVHPDLNEHQKSKLLESALDFIGIEKN